LLGLTPSTFNPAGTARASVEPEITTAVRKASLESGSPFELMMASAQMESGLRPSAKAGASSAAGLFQFTEQTWLDTVRRHGAEHGMATEASAVIDQDGRLTTSDPATRRHILNLRNDLSVASALAGDHLRDLSNKLSAGLGRAVTSGEIYLGHFLGAHGAKQIISAPQNQIAANVLPDAARSNNPLFYASDGTPFTAGQFLQHIQKRLSQAFADIGLAAPAETGAIETAAASTGIGISGHSAGSPQKIQSATEMQVMASLVEPLVQSNRDGTKPKSHHNKFESDMPAATLTALQMTTT
jgi:hypothetical protein